MAPLRPTLPTLLVGGWLGAGKTSWINALLRRAGGRRIAVLVNDFGEIGIDADLIVGAEAGVLSLAGGCLCCSFGDDLVGCLRGLARREPAPALCVIELSGVALPGLVRRTAALAPEVAVVAVLALADAVQIERQAADRYTGGTVRRQLAEADWLLPSKADGPDPAARAALAATQAWLAREWPQARLLPPGGELPVESLLELLPPPQLPPQPPPRPANAPGPAALRVPSSPRSSPFTSLAVALPEGLDPPALGRALADPALGLLRAKGLLRDRAGAPWLLQLAGGRLELSPQAFEGPGRLVLIAPREAAAVLQPALDSALAAAR